MSFPSYLLLTLTACQGGSASSKKEPQPDPAPVRAVVELREGTTLLARVTDTTPCRALVDGTELLVGARPLVMTFGSVRWEGNDIDGSTVLTRDGESVARIYPSEARGSELALFDTQGVATLRVNIDGERAIIRDRSQTPIGEVRPGATGLEVIGGPAARVVTGTTDLMLAAILAATETRFEVRALAACHRLQKAAT